VLAEINENPVKTFPFPINKRINTELLIDRKHGLYVQKWFKKLSQPSTVLLGYSDPQ